MNEKSMIAMTTKHAFGEGSTAIRSSIGGSDTVPSGAGRFEFHCHSNHSKGTKIFVEGLASPKEVVAHAKKIGLRGIALTDHDTTKGWTEARAEAKKQGVIFIPGMEVCSTEGHILGLGLSEPVRKGMDTLETMDAIRAQGAVCVAAHPFDVQGWGVRKLMDRADAVEVFNALNMDRFGNIFAEHRARKKGKIMVAGSDAHSLNTIGTACNLVDADSVDEVLFAVRHGKVAFERNYISIEQMVEWVRERFVQSYGHIQAYIDMHYHGPKKWLAHAMLNDYVISGRRGWERFSKLGLAAVTTYSAARFMAYY